MLPCTFTKKQLTRIILYRKYISHSRLDTSVGSSMIFNYQNNTKTLLKDAQKCMGV